MYQEWGSVDGDHNADAIISDRRSGLKGLSFGVFWNFGLVALFGVWYAWSETPLALVLVILSVGWLVGTGVAREVYRMHTMLMIAERRTQLIEQKLQAIAFDLTQR